MFRITDVKISLRSDEKLRAFATVTLDHCFVIRGLKVIQASRGLFIAMPARRKPDGTFQDIAHPIHADGRAYLERVVLDAFHRALEAPGAVVHAGDEEFD